MDTEEEFPREYQQEIYNRVRELTIDEHCQLVYYLFENIPNEMCTWSENFLTELNISKNPDYELQKKTIDMDVEN